MVGEKRLETGVEGYWQLLNPDLLQSPIPETQKKKISEAVPQVRESQHQLPRRWTGRGCHYPWVQREPELGLLATPGNIRSATLPDWVIGLSPSF